MPRQAKKHTQARHRATHSSSHGGTQRSHAGSGHTHIYGGSHYWNVPERDSEGRFVAGHEHDGGSRREAYDDEGDGHYRRSQHGQGSHRRAGGRSETSHSYSNRPERDDEGRFTSDDHSRRSGRDRMTFGKKDDEDYEDRDRSYARSYDEDEHNDDMEGQRSRSDHPRSENYSRY